MLQVSVTLPSGRSERLSLPESSRVGDLKILAQKLFQLGFLRVVAAGRLLDPEESPQAAGVQEGDHLTAIVVQEAEIAATQDAFALWCCGGDRIVTWGHPINGGCNFEVQDQLKGVQQVQATSCAFAAILADKSVVTWGAKKTLRRQL